MGQLFSDRYRIESELGKGEMGVVYRAHDTLLDRDVAIKVLSDSSLGAEGRARLLHEAQAVSRLNHPNIVSIHDAGDTDGIPFIVMEWVEGKSLQSCTRRHSHRSSSRNTLSSLRHDVVPYTSKRQSLPSLES